MTSPGDNNEKIGTVKEIAQEKGKKREITVIDRDENEILSDLSEIEDYLQKKCYWVYKLFIRPTKKGNVLVALILSIGIYVLAMISSTITFEGYIPTGIDLDGMTYLLDFRNDDAIDLLFTPLLLLSHLAMLTIVGHNLGKAVLVIPRLMPVNKEELKKDIDRIISNKYGFLFALPFILFDGGAGFMSFFVYPDGITGEGFLAQLNGIRGFEGIFDGFSNPIIHLITYTSYIFQWLIYGAVLNTLVMYILFIRKYTKKATYQENILSILMKNRIEPLIALGYKLSAFIGLLLLVRAAYLIAFEFWFWWSDLVGFILLLIFLPVTTVVPLQLVEGDLRNEQKKMIAKFKSKLVDFGTLFIVDKNSLPLETKIDLLLQDQYGKTLLRYRRETLKVYLRLVGVMSVTVGSLVYDNRETIMQFLEPILQSIR